VRSFTPGGEQLPCRGGTRLVDPPQTKTQKGFLSEMPAALRERTGAVIQGALRVRNGFHLRVSYRGIGPREGPSRSTRVRGGRDTSGRNALTGPSWRALGRFSPPQLLEIPNCTI